MPAKYQMGIEDSKDMLTCIEEWLSPRGHYELVSCKCHTVGLKDCRNPWVATYLDGECAFYLAKELHHKFADKLLKMKRHREAVIAEVSLRLSLWRVIQRLRYRAEIWPWLV